MYATAGIFSDCATHAHFTDTSRNSRVPQSVESFPWQLGANPCRSFSRWHFPFIARLHICSAQFHSTPAYDRVAEIRNSNTSRSRMLKTALFGRLKNTLDQLTLTMKNHLTASRPIAKTATTIHDHIIAEGKATRMDRKHYKCEIYPFHVNQRAFKFETNFSQTKRRIKTNFDIKLISTIFKFNSACCTSRLLVRKIIKLFHHS